MGGDLDARSRAILHHIVDTYIETGEPVGSKTLCSQLGLSLSPATIRNVMADLVDAGLLYAPHTSAGRLPTEAGLRLFVNGLLEIGLLPEEERRTIDERCQSSNRSLSEVFEETMTLLSGLSQCAGLVSAPKADTPLKHVEFVSISAGRALVVMVTESGVVENRIIEVDEKMPREALISATNYINARLKGRTLEEAKRSIHEEICHHKAQLDLLASKLVEAGITIWESSNRSLIVRGQSNLLREVTQVEDIENLRALFEALETREGLVQLLEAASSAEGVQIFIGAESKLFNISGCSVIVAPYIDAREQIIGAIGVVGPTRLNYAKVIPMVDYTAKIISRLLSAPY